MWLTGTQIHLSQQVPGRLFPLDVTLALIPLGQTADAGGQSAAEQTHPSFRCSLSSGHVILMQAKRGQQSGKPSGAVSTVTSR